MDFYASKEVRGVRENQLTIRQDLNRMAVSVNETIARQFIEPVK